MSSHPRPRSRAEARTALAALAGAALLGSGCSSVRYVAGAAAGELGILRRARPLHEVMADPDAPPRIRRLLSSVRSVKSFGRAHGLEPTRNYGSYADLGREAAVWVVQACPPLAFQPRLWSFPLVGSMPYLGFFDPAEARAYAEGLAAREGLEVDVRTAAAFSTLGWLSDPVLSTMIPPGDEALGELANVVLHESVHATLYVPSQSTFDESLASFVADALTGPWLASVVGPDAPATRAWERALARERTAMARLHRVYLDLDALYRSSRPDAEKLAEKARLLGAAQADLGLRRPLNNARLLGYRTYDAGRPAFERLLSACGGSFPRFMGALAALRPADFGAPQRRDLDPVLDALAARGCPRAPPARSGSPPPGGELGAWTKPGG